MILVYLIIETTEQYQANDTKINLNAVNDCAQLTSVTLGTNCPFNLTINVPMLESFNLTIELLAFNDNQTMIGQFCTSSIDFSPGLATDPVISYISSTGTSQVNLLTL